MISKKEIRAERDDVFSFWELIPTIEDGVIVQVETKLEECTILELEKRIADFQLQILDLTARIAVESQKINLINLL